MHGQLVTRFPIPSPLETSYLVPMFTLTRYTFAATPPLTNSSDAAGHSSFMATILGSSISLFVLIIVVTVVASVAIYRHRFRINNMYCRLRGGGNNNNYRHKKLASYIIIAENRTTPNKFPHSKIPVPWFMRRVG